MDERAFRDLYAAHAGEVFTYARRRVPVGDAEDVVSDVFLVAWRRRAELPHDALPWLIGVARKVLANRRRGLARSEALIARLTVESRHRAAAGDAELDSRVLSALGSLSSTDQELLLLVAWEGLERADLAAVLGISPGAVAVRLFRARRRLARVLTAAERSPVNPPRTLEEVRDA